MARYTCEEIELPTGGRGIRLADEVSDAVVVPAQGALWREFGIRGDEGERIELLYPPEAPQGGGSPVLFPVVGRSLCDGQLGAYRHGGVVRPMPIHGFAKDSAWEVSASGADDQSAWLSCTLVDSPETRAVYPYAFRVDLTYRLCGAGLALEAAATNPGDVPLPFHLGYHPYFAMPILPGGERDACELRVPSRSTWELRSSCATGDLVPLEESRTYETPRPLAGASLDRVFADLQADASGEATTCLTDPHAGRSVVMRHRPEEFPVFVVYGPAGLPFACLEPWTGLPGGLGEDMVAGRRARRLAPGERWEATVTVSIFRWQEAIRKAK